MLQGPKRGRVLAEADAEGAVCCQLCGGWPPRECAVVTDESETDDGRAIFQGLHAPGEAQLASTQHRLDGLGGVGCSLLVADDRAEPGRKHGLLEIAVPQGRRDRLPTRHGCRGSCSKCEYGHEQYPRPPSLARFGHILRRLSAGAKGALVGLHIVYGHLSAPFFWGSTADGIIKPQKQKTVNDLY